MRIILGSTSPRRLEILKTIVPAGTTLEVISPDFDEKTIRNPNPTALTMAVARAKNEAVRSRVRGDAIIVTADTVAICNKEVREKPSDAVQLRRFVDSYRSFPVTAITAVFVHRTVDGWSATLSDTATVWFERFTDAELNAIVKEEAFYGSAGGYLIDHPLMSHRLRARHGSRSTVMGLPARLTQLLIEDAIGG